MTTASAGASQPTIALASSRTAIILTAAPMQAIVVIAIANEVHPFPFRLTSEPLKHTRRLADAPSNFIARCFPLASKGRSNCRRYQVIPRARQLPKRLQPCHHPAPRPCLRENR